MTERTIIFLGMKCPRVSFHANCTKLLKVKHTKKSVPIPIGTLITQSKHNERKALQDENDIPKRWMERKRRGGQSQYLSLKGQPN